MSQNPWGQPLPSWPAIPPVGPRFDPADPLISDDYAGWWRRGFAVLGAARRPMAMLQLLLAVPVLALSIPSEIAYERQQRAVDAMLDTPGGDVSFGEVLKPGLTLMAGALPAGLIFVFAMLAAVRMTTVAATGGNPTVGAALRAALRRVPAMMGWYVVAAGICLLAVVLCFLPLLYVGAVLTILPAVVQLERGNAISRCFRLFHADIGASISRVATIGGLSLAATVVMFVATLIAQVVLQGSAAFDPSVEVSAGSVTALGVVTAVLQTLTYLFSCFILTPLTVTAYADMRARREPFSTAYLAEPATTGA